MKHALLPSVFAFATLASPLLGEPSSRISFDHDWKFARFGAMADGSVAPEPGVATGMASASSEEAGNPAGHAIDGDPNTRWCASSGAADQWLMVDLGRTEALGGIHVLWEKATGNPFSVEVSADGREWRETVARQAANAAESQLKFNASGRYFRVRADGSTGSWASIRTVAALDPQGNPLQPRPADPSALGKSPSQPEFDDQAWRELDLPHDWAIEGPFRMDIENETGKLPWVGVAWYRKTFTLPADALENRHYLDLDGAMAQPQVHVNGALAGEWKYGYNSFRVDLTPHLRPGESNTIAIRLENLPNSTRWYPGAGLYRHVWWTRAPQTHIAHWGVYVTTPEITADTAKVAVQTSVENHAAENATLTVRQEILDPAGKTVATADNTLELEAGGAGAVDSALSLPQPALWDLKTPHLYQLRTTLLAGDATLDATTTTFGVRSIEWHKDKGFLLNGRRVQLQGVCNHHDLGPLGAAAHTRAMERQIEILQEMGCNSIRTAHNPPAPELLDLCDRMGVLVIDELFDIWKMQKYGKSNGYNIFWDDWHERDVRNWMLRDRNHPCVIAWSSGNEVSELGTPSMHWVPRKLRDLIRRHDLTRPVTAGSNHPGAASNGFQTGVDAYGVNYHLGSYPGTLASLPDMPVYASETSSTVSTRGEYFFPVEWDRSRGFYQFQVSSYDLYAPGWANRPDLQFEALDKHPRVAGEYVWTGFDYLGEPTPYNQDQTNALNFTDPQERAKAMEELKRLGNRAPSRSSYFGILDLCGFKKDRFYIYQARWRDDVPVAHLLPHWNWPERKGMTTPVHAYTNGDEAELFLNGHSLGKRRRGEPHAYRFTWDEVEYQPGKLELVVTRDGKPWARALRETTGPASRLELSADRAEIAADGNDLSYLTIRVLDSRGREVPRTRIPVHVRVSGSLEIIGIGNGDPTDHTAMKPADPARATITAFNGLAQVIVKSRRGESGAGLVEIVAEGLEKTSAKVETR